jgi:hypothetical protein
MNNKIKQLAEEAGFCFWSDEPWKPAGAEIDWSSIYDDQLAELLRLLKLELLDIVAEGERYYEFKDGATYIKNHINELLG